MALGGIVGDVAGAGAAEGGGELGAGEIVGILGQILAAVFELRLMIDWIGGAKNFTELVRRRIEPAQVLPQPARIVGIAQEELLDFGRRPPPGGIGENNGGWKTTLRDPLLGHRSRLR